MIFYYTSILSLFNKATSKDFDLIHRLLPVLSRHPSPDRSQVSQRLSVTLDTGPGFGANLNTDRLR